MKTLAGLGEFPFIEAIARSARGKGSRRGVVLGIGDDAARLRLRRDAIVTVDSLVEGVHFRRTWLEPAELGRRAFRVAVSDVAACGADARFVLLALAAPSSYPARNALALVRGLIDDAARAGAHLVGGNVCRSPVLSLAVTVVGEAGPRVLTRDSARIGDTVYVTGRLGGAAAAVRHLRRPPRTAASSEGRRRAPPLAPYTKPPVRLDVGRSLARLRAIGALIDVSDGLVQDLGHICERSGVSAEIDPRAVPVARGASLEDALFGGDDYELLFTARPGAASERGVDEALVAGKCRAIPIGRIVEPRDAKVVSSTDGRALVGGYAHFLEGRRP